MPCSLFAPDACAQSGRGRGRCVWRTQRWQISTRSSGAGAAQSPPPVAPDQKYQRRHRPTPHLRPWPWRTRRYVSVVMCWVSFYPDGCNVSSENEKRPASRSVEGTAAAAAATSGRGRHDTERSELLSERVTAERGRVGGERDERRRGGGEKKAFPLESSPIGSSHGRCGLA